MSFKSIAIPPRSVTRKGGEPTRAYAPATSAPVHMRATRHLDGHRYATGDRLLMASGGRETARGASACRVVSLLPNEGGPLRYRVRSESENFERIVDEIDLSPLEPGLD